MTEDQQIATFVLAALATLGVRADDASLNAMQRARQWLGKIALGETVLVSATEPPTNGGERRPLLALVKAA
jgi:hypothetical protein